MPISSQASQGQGQKYLKWAAVPISGSWGHYAMLSSPKRKLALMLGYPKISIKTQTSVSPGFRVKVTFRGKKKKKAIPKYAQLLVYILLYKGTNFH